MVAAALLSVGVTTSPQAQAANLTWSQTAVGTYNWTDLANWGGVESPNAVGDIANLSGALAGAQTVNLNAVITVGELNFGATAPASLAGYTLAGGTNGLLVLDDTDGTVSINKLSGSPSLETISAEIRFNDALTISNNAGGGTLTITGAMRSLISDITITGAGAVAAGSIITGVISTAGGFIKEGTGIMQTNGSSTYAGTTWIKAGRLIMNNGSDIPIRSAITIDAGAILEVKGASTWGSITGAGNVTNTTATARVITIGRDDTSTNFSGTITSTTAANIALTKVGAGSLTLVPSAASTYAGNTIINGGGLVLDFANAGLLTSLLATTPLQITGGNFTMKGKAGLAANQLLGALTVGSTGGTITLVAGDVAGTVLRTGAVTATANGATLLVVDPSASTSFQMGTTYAAGLNNRLVFNDGTANSFHWATNTGANTDTVAFTGYTALPIAGGGDSTTNASLAASQAQNTAAATIRSLKLSSSGAGTQTLDLAAFNLTLGGGLTAAPGAILIDGTDGWNINGSTGVLRSSHLSAAGDVIFHQYSTGAVTVNAGIADNGAVAAAVTNLVKAGTGTLVLAGAKTFTGAVFVNGGTLQFSNNNQLGNAAAVTAVTIRDGATLSYSGATATIAATGTTAHTFTLTGGNATIEVTGATTELTLAGVISGAGGYTKTGPGILTIGASSTFTGPLFINAGTLRGAANVSVSSSSSPVTIGASGTLDIFETTSSRTSTIGALAGAGTVLNSGATAKTLIIGASNTSTTFSGSFAAGGVAGNVIRKLGSGILTLSGTSAWTGTTDLQSGVLRIAANNTLATNAAVTIGNVASGVAQLQIAANTSQTLGANSGGTTALIFYGTAANVLSNASVLIENGATLTIGATNITFNGTGVATGNPQAFISAAGTGQLAFTADRTFNIGDSSFVGATLAELVVSAPISSVGAFGPVKSGFGNLLFAGTNTYTGSTTLTAGGLFLDYSTLNTSKLNAAGALALNGGGNLILLGNASADTAQAVASTNLASGGFSTLRLTPGGSQKIALTLGAFTRATSAGTVRFHLPTGTQDSTNGFRTTSANLNGILGGWATAADAAGVTNFAANDGSGGVVLVTSVTKSDVTTWALGDHVTDGASGYAGTVSQNFGIGSLRFNSAADSAVTLADGRVLTIASGGVLQTSAASGSAVSPTLAGGRLVSGASNELIFTTDVNTSVRPLVVSSAIGGAQILTKTGDGILRLTGVNDFTGVTRLAAGTLQVDGGNAIGDNSLVNISTTRSSVFELLGNETIGGILGGNTAVGGESFVRLNANTLRINQTVGQNLTLFLTGDAGSSFVLNAGSVGNLNYNQNTTATFLGSVVINGGMLHLSGNGALGVSAITVTKAALLLDNNGGTRLGTRIPDASPITLHSADGIWNGQTFPSGLAIRTDANAGTSETIGALNFGSGASYLYATASGGTSAVAGFTASDFVRSQSATLAFRGRLLNSATNVAGRNFFRIVATSAQETAFIATLIGGGGAVDTKTISILPWAIGETADTNPGDANMGNSLATYSSAISGLRPLSLTTEYNTFATKAGATDNIRESLGSSLTGVVGTTINALVVNNSNTAAGSLDITGTGAGQTLAITSGALLFTATGATTGNPAMGLSLGGFDGGITVGSTNEYVVFVQNPTSAVGGGFVTATLGSPLVSTADITKSGRGNLVLSVANTAGGGTRKTTINEGVLQIDALDKIGGATGGLVFAGGTLRFAGAFDPSTRTISILGGGGTFDTNGNNVTFANSLGSGSGALTKDGVGVLTLNAASTLTGWTNVNAGTLALGASGAIGSGDLALSNNAVLALGAGNGAVNQTVSQLSGASTSSVVGGDAAVSVLTVNQSTTTIYAGVIGGVGANQNNLGLTKSGVGSLTLSGATLSYAGPTVVNGGTLNLAGSPGAALATSAVTVARGATLNLVNTAGQAVNLGAGVLTLGASGTGSTVLGLELGSLTAYDRISSTAAAMVRGEVLLNLTGLSGSGIGDYDLLTAASGLTSGGATYALGSLSVTGGARTLTATDTFVRLGVTAFTSDLYWSNALGDGNWTANSGLAGNFATDLAGTNANGLPGVNDRVIFSANTAGGPAITTSLNGNFSLKDLEFTANPSGVTSVSIAPGTISAGTLTLTPTAATDGIDVATNAGAITISAPVVLGANQRWNVVGGGVNGSSLIVSGAITGAFNLEKTGAGILTLAVAGSTYSGTTTVAAGVLQAGIAQGFSNASAHVIQAAGILRLNNFDATIGSLAGAGTVENAGTANARTLIAGGDNSSTTFSGTLQNGGAFGLGLAKTGTGSLTLSGANTNTGNITVNGGTLNVTGSWTGNTTSSIFVYGGTNTAISVANVSGDMTSFGHTGSNVALGVAVYNQTAGTVDVTGNGSTATYVAGAAGSYGYFNLTGGTFKSRNRFGYGVVGNLATVSRSVVYIGGTGRLDHTGGEWMLNYSNAQITIAAGGELDRTGATQPFGLIMNTTTAGGEYAVLNVAGGSLVTTTQPFKFGNSSAGGAGNNNTAIINLAGGTLQVGTAMITSLPPDGANLAYLNFAGGTLKTSAAVANWIPTAASGITFTSNFFGAIDNSALAGAPSFAGGLTFDTNGFNSSLGAVLRGASGSGVAQSSLTVTGGSNYVGAPEVIFTGGTLEAGGSPATGYALINAGAVVGIVITSPGAYSSAPTVTLTGGGGTGATVSVGTLAANSSGGLTKAGAGTLTLSGTNTYSGGTNVNNGTLALGANNVLADAGGVTITADGTFDIATFNDTVATVSLQGGAITGTTGVLTATSAYDLRDGSVDAILAGSVGLNKTTAATVTLSKANTYSGVTNITGGTLVFSAANQLGNASATNTLTLNGGTLSYTGSGTANLVANQGMTIGSSGATLNISDATGILNLQGGIVTSAAANLTKTGLGVVSVGLGGSTNLNGGNVTVSAGVLNAGFTASGLGAIAVSTGATLNLYDGSTSTMAINGLTLAAGSSLGFDLGATGVNDVLNLTGTAAITPSVSLNFNALGTLGAGSYSLLSVSTGTLNAADYVLGLAPSGLNYNFTTINAGQTLQLTTSLLNLVYWKGDVGGSWSSNNAGDTNWASDLAGSTDLAALPIATDTLVFSATSAVGPTFTTTLDGSFAADSLKFTANPVGVTAVAVNQGTSGTLTLTPASANNGISVPANVGAITIGAPIATGAIQTWEVVGGGTNGSSLTVSGAVTIGHIINKTGAGVLTLSGSNTGAGGLALAAGTLVIANNSALGAGTLSIGAGTILDTGATAIVNAGTNGQNWNGNFTFTGTNTLNLGAGAVTLGDNVIATVSAQTLTVGGAIGDGAATFGLTKAGVGVLTLNGANTYGGLTSLTNGTLNLNGDNSGAAGGVTMAAGTTLNLGHANALGSGTLTLNGGTINNTSGGALTLGGSGAQTWNTGFTFTGTHNLATGSGVVTLGANIPVTVTAGNLTVNGVIDDGLNTFSLEKTGAGTLTLGALNTYGGATTIGDGTLAFTTNQTLAAATNTLLFGATVANATPGNLVLTADATFGGAMIVNTNSATASQITIGLGKTLTFNANVQIGATAPTVNGTVTKLTLNGGGVFNVTTAAAGTFIVGGSTAAISQDATLDLTALASTTINTSATGALRVNPSNGTNVTGAKATLLLPTPVVADTVATATVTAGTIAVGNAGQFASQAGQINTISLGTGLTTLNANTINVGTGARDIGQIIYGQAGGDLKIRAADGASRATLIAIGTGTAATGTSEATTNNLVDFSSHDADILVTTLNVGNQARTGNLISEFKFGAGDSSLASVLDVINVNIGFRTGTTTTTSILTNRVNISGGTVTFGNGAGSGTGVKVGSSAYDQAGAASTIGELNISGGTVLINNSTTLAAALQLGDNVSAGGGTVTASLNLTGGTTTLGGHIIRSANALRTTSTVTLNGAGAILDMGGKNIGSASALITFNAQAGTLRNLAQLNGGGVLTKSTTGTLLLDTANAFTGGVSISATGGKIIVGHNNALGTGTITLAGQAATLELANGITVTNAMTVAASGNFKIIQLQSGAISATYSGNITNSEDVSTNFDLITGVGGTLTVSGNISGNHPLAGIEKLGVGTVILSGANSYTGTTTVSAGKLVVSSLGNGVTASSVGAAGLAPANLVLATGATLGYVGAGETSGRGFTMSSDATLEAAGTSALVVTSSAKVAFANSTATRALTLTGASTAANRFGAGLSVGGTLDADKINLVVKNGVGTWIIANGETLKSTAEIDVNVGILGLIGGVLPMAGRVDLATGTTLRMESGNTDDLGGRIRLDAGAAVTLAVASDVSFASGMTVAGAGSAAVTKTGAGKLTLAADNTAIAGGFTVAQGTLDVTHVLGLGTASATVTGGRLDVNAVVANTVNVASGGALGGTGSVATASVASGATLAPGNSAGQLTVGSLVLAGNSTFEWQVQNATNATTGYDRLVVTGNLDLRQASLNNKINLRLVSLLGAGDGNTVGSPLNFGAPNGVASIRTFQFASVPTGAGGVMLNNGVNISDVFAFNVDGFRYSDGSTSNAALWSIDWNQDSGAITLTAVPEPSTYGFGLGALALAAAAIRRRKRQAKA
jgi:autotransporter-associated beta strand protein